MKKESYGIILIAISMLMATSCVHHPKEPRNLPIVPATVDCPELDISKLKNAEKKKNYKSFREELKELLPVGSSEEDVICVLEKLDWSYIYTAPHKAYSAGKDLWGLLGPQSNKATINIILDENRKVKEVECYVSYGFLG